MGATKPGQYFNRWSNIIRYLRQSQDVVRGLGGIQVFGPCYPGPGPAANTLSAIIGAMQSHPWAVSGMPRKDQRFRMRYSGLITTPRVQRLPASEAAETVRVRSRRGVW